MWCVRPSNWTIKQILVQLLYHTVSVVSASVVSQLFNFSFQYLYHRANDWGCGMGVRSLYLLLGATSTRRTVSALRRTYMLPEPHVLHGAAWGKWKVSTQRISNILSHGLRWEFNSASDWSSMRLQFGWIKIPFGICVFLPLLFWLLIYVTVTVTLYVLGRVSIIMNSNESAVSQVNEMWYIGITNLHCESWIVSHEFMMTTLKYLSSSHVLVCSFRTLDISLCLSRSVVFGLWTF